MVKLVTIAIKWKFKKKQVGDLQSRMDSQEQSNMASQLTSVDQPGQNEQ
jgi:hypothetical protein